MKPYLILDIETGPLPDAHQRQIMPTEWPLGNTKDPEKIKAAIAEKEASWIESATLDACRCEVLAIGLKSHKHQVLIHGLTEEQRLVGLLDELHCINEDDIQIVGHRLLGFDIPILVRRMWANGIKPPTKWLNCTSYKAHREWAFDTAVEWSCGNREQYVKLDHLAFMLGVGRKTDGVQGATWWKTYAEDQKAALGYLSNDLKLTEGCFFKMR